MPIGRTSQETIDRARAERAATLSLVRGGKNDAPPPTVINVDTVALLEDPDRYTYRQVNPRTGIVRTYRMLVPTVPMRDGLRLLQLQVAIEQAAEAKKGDSAAALALLSAFVEAQAMMWRLSWPQSRALRFVWPLARRWVRNPLRDATLGEMAKLIGFFSDCRMRDHALTPDA